MNQQRRDNVLTKMQVNSLFLVHSGKAKIRNQDSFYPYRVSSHFYYLTSLNLEDSVLVIDKDEAQTRLYMPFPDIKKERWQGHMLGARQAAETLALDPTQIFSIENFWQDLPNLLKNHRTLYFDFGEDEKIDRKMLATLRGLQKKVRAQEYAPQKIIHCEEILQELRLYKMEDELQAMRQAARISARAHQELMLYARQKPFYYEYQLRAFLHQQFEKEGASSLAYDSIVAAAAHATFLHYTDNQGLAKADDLLLVDAGCEWQNYASDITRTFPLGGKFSTPQKEIYELVWQSQKEAFVECKAGSTLPRIHEKTLQVLVQGLQDLGFFKKIPDSEYLNKKLQNQEDKIEWFYSPSIEDIIDKKLYSHFYMHQTSHFIGLDVHDNNLYFAQQQPMTLQKGMVFSVEPGLYFPEPLDFVPSAYRGIGIRIEDAVAIQEQGCEILSSELPSHWQNIENL